jgi:beta-1,4-mannosyltransferase
MDLTVGYFRYEPGINPYQRLFARALEQAGLKVDRIGPRKFFPINSALARRIDLLQMDWPDTLYLGRNAVMSWAKRRMYHAGLHRLEDFPLVWTVHNLVGHDAPDAAYHRRMTQILIDRCGGIIVMSQAALRLLSENYRVPERTRVAVIPHGHYIDAYTNVVTREQAREYFSLNESGRMVLFLGSMRPYKGVEELMSAFAGLARRGDMLVLAGPTLDPAYGERLRSLAAGPLPAGAQIRVVPEAIPDDMLQTYFNAADLVALPFRSILNSGSALLAQSFARCVIAPAIGSLPEVLSSDGFFGYDPARPSALADTLRDSLARGDLLARGLRAREYLRDRYDWGGIGRRARELYEHVMERG